MKKKLKKFEKYLENTLDYHVSNDNDEVISILLDVLMEFNELFDSEENNENSD